MLRRVKVKKTVENGEVSFEPDCPPPFTVIEYKERVVGTKTNEMGETIEVKEPYAAIVETPHEVGKPSSWDEVENPIYFDIQIGDQFYSFRGTKGAIPVGLDEKGRICRIVYEEKPFFVALDEEGKQIIKKTRKVRKLIPPDREVIAIRNKRLGILEKKKKDGVEKEEFIEDKIRLGDIELRRESFVKKVREVIRYGRGNLKMDNRTRFG